MTKNIELTDEGFRKPGEPKKTFKKNRLRNAERNGQLINHHRMMYS